MTTKKEQCKDIMAKLFGPATARLVDDMSEAEVVEKCRAKVESFYGKEKGKIFDEVK